MGVSGRWQPTGVLPSSGNAATARLEARLMHAHVCKNLFRPVQMAFLVVHTAFLLASERALKRQRVSPSRESAYLSPSALILVLLLFFLQGSLDTGKNWKNYITRCAISVDHSRGMHSLEKAKADRHPPTKGWTPSNKVVAPNTKHCPICRRRRRHQSA